MSVTIVFDQPGVTPLTLGVMSAECSAVVPAAGTTVNTTNSILSTMPGYDGATDVSQWVLANCPGDYVEYTFTSGSLQFTIMQHYNASRRRYFLDTFVLKNTDTGAVIQSFFGGRLTEDSIQSWVKYWMIYPTWDGMTKSCVIDMISADGQIATNTPALGGVDISFAQLAKKEQKFPGVPSTTGGGIGDFDLTSDPIDFPSLPSTGAVNSKFVSLYNPTESELNQIQSYLWTTDMGQAWEAIFKFIQDPMDMVIGLNMFPFTIPSAGLSPAKVPVEAGIIDIMVDPLTKVTSYKLLSQYIELDCGTLDVGQFYGTALDFQPYTKATIHVPFCGDYPLNIDDIRSNLDASVNGKTLHLKYHVDMFSGACVAMLKVGDAVLYQWSGSMAMNVPLTGSDYSNTIQNVISTATTIGLGASTSGVGAAGAAGAAEAESAAKVSSAAAASDSHLANLAGAATNMASSLKPQIQRAGSVAGSAGFLGVQAPYIVFEIPRQSIAEDYAKFMGFPCNVSYTLSSLVGKGFTVVSDMHLENITTNTAAIKSGATDNELGEIEKLLSGGVIL